ncbi:MAG TPA: hypothetical protein VFY29_05090 [Terriglobia bacterium]|nr:hypothetical protein [Terriglobia bacterium]
MQHGSVTADLARRRTLTFGDQTTISGIDALTSSVRGARYTAPFRTFETSVYAGAAARTVHALPGAPGVAEYDLTIIGGSMRRRSAAGDLSFGTNTFTSAERKGTSIGTGFVKTTEKNQFRAQVAAGAFSGFSLGTANILVDNLQAIGGPSDEFAPAPERLHVRGGALGFSFVDTYRPIEPLAITAQLDRYGRNFLTAREDSEYHAQDTERLSLTLRPLSTLNLYGGIMRRVHLVGDPGGIRAVNYGASGTVKAIPWLQMGYFRLVQNDTSSASGRLALSQYSATLVNLLQYSASFMFSDLRFNETRTHTINAIVGRDVSSYGHLSFHDQLQFNTLHRYGGGWQFDIPHGNLRLGLDRWTNSQTSDHAYAPVLALVLKLRGKQRLVATYSGERGTHMLSVVIAGPVFNRENLRRSEDGRVSRTAEASLEGRVYKDANDDGAFSLESDTGMSGVTIWLDSETSTVADEAGEFRFERLKPGSHALRADLADVPADMVFAGSGDRRIAVLPFRNNVQNFPVVRTGLVSGKTTYLDYSDPDNPVERPLPEARVIADSEHDTYSDVEGNLTIGSLTPGTYRLKVDPESIPEGYVARVEPEEVKVSAGEILRGVRIRLELAPKAVVIRDLPKQQSVTAP